VSHVQPHFATKSRLEPNALVTHVLPWVVPTVLFIVWQWASSVGLLPSRFLPASKDVVKSFFDLSGSGELWAHVRVSSLRALSGFAVGGGLGLLLGLLTGSLHWAETLLDTTIQMVRNIPPLALIPLVILWFGIDESPSFFWLHSACSFPSTSTLFTAFDPSIADFLRWARPTVSRAGPCTAKLFSPAPCPRYWSACASLSD
jgi:ABC-type nitrate/sulfonate/bicarbonate transport system permease component